eukprot:CAMPEP_0202732064 /NCGR_PEP_ID=MMETSP1385-20130828/187463_1 /ASSEMBLY_ACC=CAM_ASM_000861 /TAXON_ID=933848 /ORGANISM="Elphidium margaritaceum" /LENGTH=488 /DNA_ID=CAMNT_0049398367 /DNA_START=1 /DNA_END=1467 /DNA_ORIENTATION=-
MIASNTVVVQDPIRSPTAASLNITTIPPKSADASKPLPYVPHQHNGDKIRPNNADAEQRASSSTDSVILDELHHDSSMSSHHDSLDDVVGQMQYQQSLESSMDDTLNRDMSVLDGKTSDDDEDDDDGMDMAAAVHSLYHDDPDINWSDDGDNINASECQKGYLSSPTHIVSPQNDTISGDDGGVQSPSISHSRSGTVRVHGACEADKPADDEAGHPPIATQESDLEHKWLDIFEQQKKESEQQVQQLQQQLQALTKQLHAKADLHQRKLAAIRPEAPIQAMLSTRTQRISISNTLPLRHLRDETQTFEYGHKFDPAFAQKSVTLTVDGEHDAPMVRMFDIPSNPYFYGGQSSYSNVFSMKSKTASAWAPTSISSQPSQMSKMSQSQTVTLSSTDFEDSKEESASFSLSPTLTPTCTDTERKDKTDAKSGDGKTSVLMWFLRCACFDWKICYKPAQTTNTAAATSYDRKQKRKRTNHGKKNSQTEITLP